MSAKGVTLVTLSDVAKNKNVNIGDVAEVLVQSNPILNDIPYMEMNEGTIHKETLRSDLPEVYYRKANQAIPASKTSIEERTFTSAHFESKVQMDEAVASRGGKDRIAFNRWNQAEGHIQAMGLEHAELLIYGSPDTDSMKVPGIFDILSTLSASEPTSKQIIDAGGTGSDNTSIVIIEWGPQSVFGVYPKGSQAGLKRTDRTPGDTRVKIQGLTATGATGEFWGLEEQFEIDHGLVVKDYRYIARIANIDVSDLTGGSAADLLKFMTRAMYLLPQVKKGVRKVYMNSTIAAFLHEQALEKVGAGGGLTFENYQGAPVMMFLGCPVVVTDALLNTEAQVV